jgi:hypothetical protein
MPSDPHTNGDAGPLVWIAAMLASVLLLSAPALYNGYPLVESDTGTYVESAFVLRVPPDRPIGYSLFLDAASWRWSLWPVVFVQALLVVLLLPRVLRVLGVEPAPGRLVGLTLLLALTTPLPWYTSQVMPDVFTGIGVLLVTLIALERGTSWAWRAGYGLLLLVATLSHFSHLLAVTAMLPVVAAVRVWRPTTVARANLVAVALHVALCWLAVPTVNWLIAKRAFITSSGHVFVMARLYRAGLLTRFLQEECGHHSWALCAIKDDPVRDESFYIWHPDGPLHRLGGWSAKRKEQRRLIRKIVRRYPLEVSRDAAGQVLRQLVSIRFDYLTALGREPERYVNGVLRQRFPEEFARYVTARQYEGRLPLRAVTAISTTAVVVAAVVLLLAVAGAAEERVRAFALVALAGVVLNGAVCGSLSLTHPRYQARIVWLVPLIASAVALQMARRAQPAHDTVAPAR